MTTLQIANEPFSDLFKHTDDICVSIFMPTHPVHLAQPQADSILLKNLIDRAASMIAAYSPFVEQAEITQLLQPVNDLLAQDGDFWQHQSDGLAIFVNNSIERVYRLPMSVTPRVEIGPNFYIRPLLPIFVEIAPVYILALSHNQVRLLRATQTTLEVIPLPNVPANLEESTGFSDSDKQRPFTGQQAGVFYSAGDSSSAKKEQLLRYCKQVDAGLQPWLTDEGAPLIVAAVAYVDAVYRQVNSYPHLLPQFIAGSPDRVADHTLQQQALALVKPSFEQKRLDRLQQVRDMLGQRRALTDVGTILQEATRNRIHQLFLDNSMVQWGYFDRKSGAINLHQFSGPFSVDLMNVTAIETLNHGGAVYWFESGELPPGIKMVALPRF